MKYLPGPIKQKAKIEKVIASSYLWNILGLFFAFNASASSISRASTLSNALPVVAVSLNVGNMLRSSSFALQIKNHDK